MASDITNVRPEIKEFIKILREASPNGSIRMRDVFRDFVSCASRAYLQVSNSMVGTPDMELEEEVKRIQRKYSNPGRLGEALAVLDLAIGERHNPAPYDFLGQAYMAMEDYNAHTGQFFTPQGVSDMMARITFEGVTLESFSEEYDNGMFCMGRRCLIGEPASGSGGMLIAAHKLLRDKGIPPWKFWFEAIDLDPLCREMCFLQMSLIGAPAVCFQGNTLGPNAGKDGPGWVTIVGKAFPLTKATLCANNPMRCPLCGTNARLARSGLTAIRMCECPWSPALPKPRSIATPPAIP